MQLYLPIAELPVDMFTILAMSAAVGFVSGIFGVGGGFLMTPLLVFLGVPPAVAVATGCVQIAASSTTGVLTYARRRAIDRDLGGILVLGGLAGTLAGVFAFNALRRAGQFELVLVIAYVALLSTVGGLMFIESVGALFRKTRGRPVRLKRAGHHGWYERLPLRRRFPQSRLYASVLPLLGLGLFIGFVGVLLGIGGGFIVVPALLYLFSVPTSVVVGTSLYQILFTMAAAILLHAVTNQSVDIVLGLLLIVGGVIGAQFGTRAGQNLRGEGYRLLLALMILAVALRFMIELVVRPAEPFSLG